MFSPRPKPQHDPLPYDSPLLRTVGLPAFRNDVIVRRGGQVRISQPEDYGDLPRLFLFEPKSGAWRGVQLEPGTWVISQEDDRPVEAASEIVLP